LVDIRQVRRSTTAALSERGYKLLNAQRGRAGNRLVWQPALSSLSRVRTFLEFGMPADIADKYAQGGRLSGLPE